MTTNNKAAEKTSEHKEARDRKITAVLNNNPALDREMFRIVLETCPATLEMMFKSCLPNP